MSAHSQEARKRHVSSDKACEGVYFSNEYEQRQEHRKPGEKTQKRGFPRRLCTTSQTR